MDHTTILLTELVSKATKLLETHGYAERTKNNYVLKWKRFQKYAEQKGHSHFSKELGKAFLEECYGIKNGMKLTNSQVFKVRTITVLVEVLENNCLHIPAHPDGESGGIRTGVPELSGQHFR